MELLPRVDLLSIRHCCQVLVIRRGRNGDILQTNALAPEPSRNQCAIRAWWDVIYMCISKASGNAANCTQNLSLTSERIVLEASDLVSHSFPERRQGVAPRT
jgi:hypothetical protein